MSQTVIKSSTFIPTEQKNQDIDASLAATASSDSFGVIGLVASSMACNMTLINRSCSGSAFLFFITSSISRRISVSFFFTCPPFRDTIR